MNRRDFFRAAGLGLGLLSAPHLIQDAFAADVDPETELESLAAAFKRAHDRGAYLLVLVIPEDPGRRWQVGHAFGELLQYGPDETLARLSEVELVCAQMKTVRELVPAAPDDEPHMVLVQTDRVPASTRAIRVDLGAEDGYWRGDGDLVQKRIDSQADALNALLPKPGAAKARADSFRASMSDPVPGSLWANATGCGTHIEGVPDNRMYACGMGHVPARSRRFLYLFDPDELVF